MDGTFKDLMESILEGDVQRAESLIDQLQRSGCDPMQIVTDAIKPAMEELGRRFERGEVFLPTIISASMLFADFNKNAAASEYLSDAPTIIMGTVSTDIHEIGKNICASMARIRGYNVMDLGCDVPSEKFISQAVKHGSGTVAVSSTMKSSLKYQQEIVELAAAWDLSVLVGGASCSPEWCGRIGAAGYSRDCVEFVQVLAELHDQS